MNIEIFGQTYADDIPNLTSPNLINHLVEIANSLTQVQKTTPMTMSRFEFPEAELWKYNVLLRIQDIMKDTSYKRDFLFWLESKMKILKIVVPLSSIIFGLLTQQAVQGWINQNATQILSWVSGSTSLIGFVLAIIIWVRHRFQKTKEKA